MLRYRCENMDGKTIGLRKINGFEVDPGLHQVRHEGNVSSEPVELRN
jgi:hypothetical protein